MTLNIRSQGAVLMNRLVPWPAKEPLEVEALAHDLGNHVFHASITIPSLKCLALPPSPAP
jgi:hypothetical protein